MILERGLPSPLHRANLLDAMNRQSHPGESSSGLKPALLVIGYGNTLRADDGVGPRVAEAVGSLGLPGVRTLICQQLSPEHADPISQADAVVFVDAAVDAAREVQLRLLEPSESSQLMAHAADPRTMLALARDVFGHAPEAWWLTIPAVELGFGETLSPAAERGLQEAVKRIQSFCQNHSLALGGHSFAANLSLATDPKRGAV
jgi:hydrogenase maturation protease